MQEEVELVVTRKAAALVAALTGAAVLAGCTATPGVAARVDDRTITQDRLVQAQQDLSAVGIDLTVEEVLLNLVLAPIFLDAAAKSGVGVSADEALAAIEQNAADTGVDPVPEVGDGALEFVRVGLSAGLLAQQGDEEATQEVREQLAALDPEINPRYGELDMSQAPLAITREPLPWIVSGG